MESLHIRSRSLDAGSVPTKTLSHLPASDPTSPGDAVRLPIRQKRYWGELIATLLLFVIAFGEHLIFTPRPLPFLEGDFGLSFPLTRPETVPIKWMFIYSTSVPMLCILFGHLLQALRTRSSFKTLLVSYLWCSLGMLQALGIVFAFVNTLKFMTGRQRPNFFGSWRTYRYR